mgnify:CR=1 FL=1
MNIQSSSKFQIQLSTRGIQKVGFIVGMILLQFFLAKSFGIILVIDLTLILLLAASVWTDILYGVIPNFIIGCGLVSAGVFLILGELKLTKTLIAAASILVLLLLICWLSEKFFGQPGLGMGDLKLFFVLGLYLGWEIFWVLYIAVMVGGLFAICGIIVKYLSRKSRLPFAPFIAIAFLVTHYFLPLSLVMGYLR